VPDEFKAKVEELAAKIEEHNIPQSNVEICKDGRDRCLASGASKNFCWLKYGQFLHQHLDVPTREAI
jgi:hypothetical protein